MFFHCLFKFIGPGTSPIRFVLKIHTILMYLCVRGSDVVSKLALGRFVFDPEKNEEFARPPNLRKPRVPIEKKNCRAIFGARYTEIRPRSCFWTFFIRRTCFGGEPLVKLQNTKVLLNSFREPYGYYPVASQPATVPNSRQRLVFSRSVAPCVCFC